MEVASPPAEAIALIPVLSDNYVIVLHDGERAVVVDPAEADPVRHWLLERRLELVAVLQTHHHADHIGGTPELLRHWPAARVYAAAADLQRIPFQDHGLVDGECFSLLGRAVQVLAVPGHTRAHLAFYLPPPPGDPTAGGELFCGDTLFAAGCGRLFEGTPAQMFASLRRLAALPPATRVWCAHEYTEANLRWATATAPAETAIRSRLEQVRGLRSRGEATIPSSIGLELATNLFLRAGDAEELARLRQSKNDWRG
jgi:hydroxyacylglutathione hydrolase